jgi:NADH:ubiquinone oxidoreductase subunit F (NADH-binding)
MMADPHSLIEGIVIASYAVRCNVAFIYLRGELVHALRRLQYAIREAYDGRLPRHRHHGHRLRPGAGGALRRRRVHLR